MATAEGRFLSCSAKSRSLTENDTPRRMRRNRSARHGVEPAAGPEAGIFVWAIEATVPARSTQVPSAAGVRRIAVS